MLAVQPVVQQRHSWAQNCSRPYSSRLLLPQRHKSWAVRSSSRHPHLSRGLQQRLQPVRHLPLWISAADGTCARTHGACRAPAACDASQCRCPSAALHLLCAVVAPQGWLAEVRCCSSLLWSRLLAWARCCLQHSSSSATWLWMAMACRLHAENGPQMEQRAGSNRL